MENSRLDISLDDLIKKNKSSSSSRRGGAAPSHRFNNRTSARSAPYSMRKPPVNLWQFGNPGGSIETGTKLYISNLDYGVSTNDIKELFSELGDLKRYNVHYDRSGKSKGTAEVVFSRRNDAIAAVKRYNNVELDGKPMKLEIVGTNVGGVGVVPPPVNSFPRNSFGFNQGGRGRGGPMGRPHGGRGSGRGGGRGRGRGRDEKISAEDLDAELEKYHSAAKTEEPMKTDQITEAQTVRCEKAVHMSKFGVYLEPERQVKRNR